MSLPVVAETVLPEIHREVSTKEKVIQVFNLRRPLVVFRTIAFFFTIILSVATSANVSRAHQLTTSAYAAVAKEMNISPNKVTGALVGLGFFCVLTLILNILLSVILFFDFKIRKLSRTDLIIGANTLIILIVTAATTPVLSIGSTVNLTGETDPHDINAKEEEKLGTIVGLAWFLFISLFFSTIFECLDRREKKKDDKDDTKFSVKNINSKPEPAPTV